MMPLATCHLGKEQSQGIAFNQSQKMEAFRQVLNGIKEVHRLGHVHRDIKPANILRFDENNSFNYAVSDFGLVMPTDRNDTTNITSTHAAYGTEMYMAPECFRFGFKDATCQSDIYSLGVLFLFLIVDSIQDLGYPYSERQIAGDWQNFVSKCTKQDPQQRYSSIEEMEIEFNRVLANLA